MIEKIIDGIISALYEEFGEGYRFYTEAVEQGLQEPCFFVFCVSPGIRLFRGRRYLNTNQFAIQYLSGGDEPMTDCNRVAERLFSCLELISVGGDLLRGTNAESTVADGVLTYTVNYDYFSYIPNTETEMESLEDGGTEIRE